MKFLLDANLSPAICPRLLASGHEGTCHVREVGMRDAPDEDILEYARANGFVLISQDSDFTNLLFRTKSDRPSLILLREVQEVAANDIAGLVLVNLAQIQQALETGAVVSVVGDRIRIRALPIA
ncbi:MAG: DUF5615 family PIN-like protein [Micromonosporaceae bacterium]